MFESDIITLAVPVNERDHATGSINAKVTVVTYGDYESPDSQKRHRASEKMARQLLDSVRLVYRHFPLVKVHPRALRAAEAAEAASAQDKFWDMHRLLYLRPDKLDDQDLRRHARAIGLDLERFDREMNDGIYADQIIKEFDFSLVHGITGVPTTFINGVLYAKSGMELIAEVKAIAEGRRER